MFDGRVKALSLQTCICWHLHDTSEPLGGKCRHDRVSGYYDGKRWQRDGRTYYACLAPQNRIILTRKEPMMRDNYWICRMLAVLG